MRFRQEGRTYNFKDRDNIEKLNQNDYINNIYNFPKSHVIYFCNEDPQRIAAVIYSMVKHEDLVNIFVKKYS